MTQTDEMLMLQVRGGDVDKLGILFDRHHRTLFDFFARTMGSRTVAEDLVQDVFFRILKYSETFRDAESFKAWMFRIARNGLARYYEGQPPESAPIEEDGEAAPESRGPIPGAALEHEQQTALLERAMLKLDPGKREVLVLSRYQEMSYDEIANVWGCGTGAVKVGAHRALKELREIFLKLSNEKPSCNVKKFENKLQSM